MAVSGTFASRVNDTPRPPTTLEGVDASRNKVVSSTVGGPFGTDQERQLHRHLLQD